MLLHRCAATPSITTWPLPWQLFRLRFVVLPTLTHLCLHLAPQEKRNNSLVGSLFNFLIPASKKKQAHLPSDENKRVRGEGGSGGGGAPDV